MKVVLSGYSFWFQAQTVDVVEDVPEMLKQRTLQDLAISLRNRPTLSLPTMATHGFTRGNIYMTTGSSFSVGNDRAAVVNSVFETPPSIIVLWKAGKVVSTLTSLLH